MARDLRASPYHAFSLAAHQARLGALSDAREFSARHSAEILGTWVSRSVYLQDLQDHGVLSR